ncbi:MAG: aminopeptidase P family protein [Bryobacterales bacterium]|nr:aminopeptidase P family protein [Acidobacteriota bacterium]MCB9384801.1 aminopeptidase P family protein [Bryobacterales bacterium]
MTEFASRLGSLRRALARRSYDAFYVGCRANVRYLTGFTGSSGELLVTADGATLCTDGRYRTQAAEQTSGIEVAVSTDISPLELMLEQISGARIRSLGFEANRIGYAQYRALLGARPKLRLEPVEAWVESLRAVKSEAEIETLRRSAELNSSVFEAVLARWRPSWTERRVAGEIVYEISRQGGERPSFEAIVAGGTHSALPHASPRPVRPPRRSLVVLDHGAILGGYASDMTRMASWGDPGPAARRIFDAVLEAQLAALDAVKAGVMAKTVDRAARSVLKKHGLAEYFSHSTGHGLGLEIHERPKLGQKETVRLQEGMVITIEPGAYVPEIGGVRIEDMAVVRRSGCEILTPTPKALRIL